MRFWLAGLSLLSFAVAYTAPIVAAFELPAQSTIASPLPALTLPAVAFPSLEVPKVSPPLPRAAIPERSTAADVSRRSAQARMPETFHMYNYLINISFKTGGRG